MALNYGNKDQIFHQAQEKFRSVDAEVIYMILTECDFNLQQAESSLRELSIHAVDDDYPAEDPMLANQTPQREGYFTGRKTEPTSTDSESKEAKQSKSNEEYSYMDNLPSVYDSFYLRDHQSVPLNLDPPPNVDDVPEEPQQMNPWSTASGDDECSASDVLARLLQGDIEEILRNKQAQHQPTQQVQDILPLLTEDSVDEDYSMNEETIIHNIENIIEDDDDDDEKESFDEFEAPWTENKENIETECIVEKNEIEEVHKVDAVKPITKIVVNLNSYTNVGYYNGVHLSFNGDATEPAQVKGLYPPPECKTMFRKKEFKKIKVVSESIVQYSNDEKKVDETFIDVESEVVNASSENSNNNNENKKLLKESNDDKIATEKHKNISADNELKEETKSTNLTPTATNFVLKQYSEPPNLRRSFREPPPNMGMLPNNGMFPPYGPGPMQMMYPQQRMRMFGPGPPHFMPMYRNPMMPGQFPRYYNPFRPMYPPTGRNFQPPPGLHRMPMFMNHRQSMGYRVPADPQDIIEDNYSNDGVLIKIMFIMRGLPGSGKSTLARLLKGPSGSILTADDYFVNSKGVYEYNPEKIPAAHEWNKKRTKKLVQEGVSPIIIDNTNCTAWEMKPYAELAIKNCYQVRLREPDTPWKFKCGILAQKNIHGVPKDKIKRMLENYEHGLTVEKILKCGSRPTSHNNNNNNETKSYQLSRPQYNTEPILPSQTANIYNKKGVGPRLINQNHPPLSISKKHPLHREGVDVVENKRQKENSDSSSDSSPHPLSSSTPITNSNQSAIVSKKKSLGTTNVSQSTPTTITTATVQQSTAEVKNSPKKDHQVVKETMKNGNIKLSLEHKSEIAHRFPFKNTTKTKSTAPKKKTSKNEDAKPASSHDSDIRNMSSPTPSSSSTSTSSDSSATENSEQSSPEILKENKPTKTDIDPVNFDENKTPIEKLKTEETNEKAVSKIEPSDNNVQSKTGLYISIPSKAAKPKIAAVFSQEVKSMHTKESALGKIALNYADTPSVHQVEEMKDPFQQHELLVSETNWSQTEEYDFTSLRKANVSSEDVDGKVMTGKGERFLSAPFQLDEKIVEEATFDKSTLTDELQEEIQNNESQTVHDLETLKLLFDDIPESKLLELYNDCSKNLDWTTNILAESSIFGNNASISTLIKENKTIHGSHDIMSDYSCCKNAEKTNIEMESAENIVEVEPVETNSIQQAVEEMEENEAQFVLNNPRLKQAGTPSTPPSTPQEDLVAGLFLPPVRVKLSKGLVDSLVEVFGDVPEVDGVHTRNYEVNLPHHLAKQLHKTWMDAEITRRKMQSAARHFTQKQMSSLMTKHEEDRIHTWEMEEARKLHSQLEEDEMFARRLQQAENRGETEYTKPPLEDGVPLSRKMKKKSEKRQNKTTQLIQYNRPSASSDIFKDSSSWSPLENAWSDIQPYARATSSSNVDSDEAQSNYDSSNDIRQIMREEIAAEKSQQRQKQNLDQIGLATKLKLEQLRKDYPGLPKELLEDIFVGNNYDMESTVYSINCLWIDDARPPADNILSCEARKLFDQQAMESGNKKTKSVPKLQEPLIKLAQSQNDTEVSLNEEEQQTATGTYDEHRQNANQLKARMMESFDKARNAFTRNQREMATFYAHQGHDFQRRYKMENEKAAEMIYNERNVFRSGKEVDLHGLHVQEAIRILAQSINERKKILAAQSAPSHLCVLHVITGRGLSSQGGVSKIRQTVKEWLNANNYKYEFINPGLIEIKF